VRLGTAFPLSRWPLCRIPVTLDEAMNDPKYSSDTNTPKKRPGALVEDETLVGKEDGSVETRKPDGKVEEGATDKRENRPSS